MMADKSQPNSAPFLLIVGELPALRSQERGNRDISETEISSGSTEVRRIDVRFDFDAWIISPSISFGG
ncbi:hypothetical protein AB3X96_30460 [Paraburkholderia sp. BR13439]